MNEIWAKAADLSEQLAFDNATLLLLGFSFLVIAIIFGVSLLILLTSRAMRTDKLAMRVQDQWRNDLNTAFGQGGNLIVEKIKTELMQTQRDLGKTFQEQAKEDRGESFNTLSRFQSAVTENLTETNRRLDAFTSEQSHKTDALTDRLREAIQGLTDRVDTKLKEISSDNEAKLEKIRITVEEKLQTSIKDKVSESFESISNRLYEVSKSIGEMNKLAQDIGKIRGVLSNVKTRGVFGEVQLETLLSQFLTVDQYEKNVHTNKEDRRKNVEFAVKFPGLEGQVCYLPIDSKLPLEVYERMQDFYEKGEIKKAEEQKKIFEKTLKEQAGKISQYIDPPNTTDFAILFLPFEGLYATALSIPGLSDEIYKRNRVFMMGPSTLASALCAYRAGFQSLAIEKKTSEIRNLLTEVREEFGRFGEVIDKLKKNLEAATKTVNDVQNRTTQMGNKLVKLETTGEFVPIMAREESTEENR